MATARSLVLSEEGSIYHCISRCVRRSFLCGYDKYTGKDFNHRRQWVEDRIAKLSKIFVIDILDFALMSNHQHLMLRTDPDKLKFLDKRMVLERWQLLYPKKYVSRDQRELEMKILLEDSERIAELRDRLGSVSWYMKSLNEYIARKANKEDGCTGRFWEGRFKCQRLDTEAAVLACSVYINLNPIRAKMAKTPESSQYTSAYVRIKDLQSNRTNSWLSPVDSNINEDGYLPLSFTEYLEILNESGKYLSEGKRGAISEDLKPIMERIGVKPSYWYETSQHVCKWFSCVIAGPEAMQRQARIMGKAWIKGMPISSKIFL